MKLPRWLVISMLTSSALAVLAAAGWWWVTWPERTADEFVAALIDGRVDDVLTMIGDDPSVVSDEDKEIWRSDYKRDFPHLEFGEEPTMFDRLRCRREFNLIWLDARGESAGSGARLLVIRGNVMLNYEY